jgi:hypothetical protein
MKPKFFLQISDHQQRLAPSRAFLMPLSLLVVADFSP